MAETSGCSTSNPTQKNKKGGGGGGGGGDGDKQEKERLQEKQESKEGWENLNLKTNKYTMSKLLKWA